MPDIDLFTWWVISISFSSVFLTLVSIYLYANSRPRRRESAQKKATKLRLGKDFMFVWVLLGLLVFYIFSIQLGAGALSEEIFAIGNIVVEALLILYIVRNRTENSEQT